MIRVLKPGGVLYLAIPDKRYTFDIDRPVTPLAHLWQDFEQGPARSRKGHFQEWARLVNKVRDDDEAQKRADYLEEIDYSIHFHVWTQAEMFELIMALRQYLGLSFDVELFLKNDIECIFILRKNPPNQFPLPSDE
jgi:predicted SAM-dependent methyltransferase